ncbi:hypothetical protein DL769_001808 [Monosporascus sp. CRB-8-3]|nr:hypothetical protein DL769_001808 [Monosporascus sp. CRB-8-3]
MAITREPSLRSRTGWMKWGSSSNLSAESAPSTAPESPCEIVHLGGSRVNTPDLDSFLSAVREERLTLWPVGPPPEPPAGEPKSQDVWPLTPASDVLNVSSNPTPSPGLRPEPLRTQGSMPWDKAAPSPAFSSRTYSGTSSVDSAAAGHLRLRRSQSTNELQQRRMQQHQQLPSPSRSASRERRLHWSSSSHGGGGFGGGIGSCLSSRAQQQKTLPSQPEEREDREATPAHVATLMAKDSGAAGAKSLPPPVGPPPSTPLPIIKEPSAQSKETSTAAAPAVTTTTDRNGEKSRRPPRHTPQERLWLHLNYRGEAPFLKAWGLSINSEDDREEGKAILQDLMRGEEEESSSTARLSSASSSYSQRGLNPEPERHSKAASDEGLHVIQEEDTWARLTGESRDSKGNRISQGDLQKLRTSATELSSQIASKEHARSESEDSVLHTYLRTWDKR